MKYAYYPGCSLEKNAAAYNESFARVARELEQEIVELNDWNCCGATEYSSLDLLPATALQARNLALVPPDQQQLVAACSLCYLNLFKTDHNMGESPQLNADVNVALAEAKLAYKPGSVQVRHALDILVNDVGLDKIKSRVQVPLRGLKLVPYYGCLIVRPSHGLDNPEHPELLDRLLEALGATVLDYPLKAACCGGHMPQIDAGTAYGMVHELIATAADRGADAMVTLCPMCQLNIDAYQNQANAKYGTHVTMPVVYFTQLMGLAFGLSSQDMHFDQGLVSTQPLLTKLATPPPAEDAPKRKPARDKNALPMPGVKI